MGKILLVDDEPDMLEVWVLFFRPTGHEVKKAHNGEEALTIAQTFLPDLMILDLMMPGVSGEEVLKRAKDIEVMKNIKIYLIVIGVFCCRFIRMIVYSIHLKK